MSFARGFVGGFSWIRYLPLRPLRGGRQVASGNRSPDPDDQALGGTDDEDDLGEDYEAADVYTSTPQSRIVIDVSSVATDLRDVGDELSDVIRVLERETAGSAAGTIPVDTLNRLRRCETQIQAIASQASRVSRWNP